MYFNAFTLVFIFIAWFGKRIVGLIGCRWFYAGTLRLVGEIWQAFVSAAIGSTFFKAPHAGLETLSTS